jgi:large subunit ribosomal protein L15
MDLSSLSKLKNSKSKSKRLGRGYSSGKGGHTVGRGAKGQKARNKPKLGFEGGQVPLYKRLPEIGGFKNVFAKKKIALSLDRFNKFKDGEKVTPLDLVKTKIIKKVPRGGIKILASGELKKQLTFSGFEFSKKAEDLISKSGSKIE